MINKIFMIIVFLFFVCFAWGPNMHYKIGAEICDDSRIRSLANELGIIYPIDDGSLYTYHTLWSVEPPDNIQNGWDNICTWSAFKSYWGTGSASSERLSQLLHIITDANVPVNHSPAWHVFKNDGGAEEIFEGLAEFQNDMPSPNSSIQNIKPASYFTFERYYNSITDASLSVISYNANEYLSTKSRLPDPSDIPRVELVYKTSKCGDFKPCVSTPKPPQTKLPEVEIVGSNPPQYTYTPNIDHCKSSAIAMGREIIYIWLYCYKNGWDKPPYKEQFKKDISSILGLLLND